MWKIIIANESDSDFLKTLSDKILDQIIDNFKEVIVTFDKITSSVYCSSGIFEVTEYDMTNDSLSIHYHVDNDEEIIRITTIMLES